MDNEGQVLLELEKLRGAVNQGFAQLAGRMDTGDQKTDAQGDRIHTLERDFEALKAKVWKLCMLAAAGGTAGATGLTQLISG